MKKPFDSILKKTKDMIFTVDLRSCIRKKKYAIVSVVLEVVSMHFAVSYIFARNIRKLVMEGILVKLSQSWSLLK